jgi:hypothetical protein
MVITEGDLLRLQASVNDLAHQIHHLVERHRENADPRDWEARRFAQLLDYVYAHQPVELYGELTAKAKEFGYTRFPNRTFSSTEVPNGVFRKVTVGGTVMVELTDSGIATHQALLRYL